MDTKALIREAHARFDHNLAKQHLLEKYKAKLILASQGGLWKITPELIGYLSSIVDEETILLDSYENPILVNRAQLHQQLRDTYIDVMSLWYKEFQDLSHKR